MYFITTITHLVPLDVPFDDERWKKQSSRCVGYFPTLEEAKKRVTDNTFNLNETIYDYAVIEKLGEGLYPEPEEEVWFCYNTKKETYEEIEKPNDAEHFSNWSIG